MLARRSFGTVGGRQQQPANTTLSGRRRDRQHAPRSLDAAIQGQFADDEQIVDDAPANHSSGRQHAQGDREIERCASFADVGRRQIDDDSAGWKVEP